MQTQVQTSLEHSVQCFQSWFDQGQISLEGGASFQMHYQTLPQLIELLGIQERPYQYDPGSLQTNKSLITNSFECYHRVEILSFRRAQINLNFNLSFGLYECREDSAPHQYLHQVTFLSLPEENLAYGKSTFNPERWLLPPHASAAQLDQEWEQNLVCQGLERTFPGSFYWMKMLYSSFEALQEGPFLINHHRIHEPDIALILYWNVLLPEHWMIPVQRYKTGWRRYPHRYDALFCRYKTLPGWRFSVGVWYSRNS